MAPTRSHPWIPRLLSPVLLILGCTATDSRGPGPEVWGAEIRLEPACPSCVTYLGFRLQENEDGTIAGDAASYMVNSFEIVSAGGEVAGAAAGGSIELDFLPLCRRDGSPVTPQGFRGRLSRNRDTLAGSIWGRLNYPDSGMLEVPVTLLRGNLDQSVRATFEEMAGVACE
jgi:hypothetical protein